MKIARHRKARAIADHRRDAVRGRQALAGPALLLVELAGLRALAHGAALHHPGARLRRLRPRHREVRGPHQGLPAEVARRCGQRRTRAAATSVEHASSPPACRRSALRTMRRHARRSHVPGQGRPGRDAQGRRHHGRRRRRAGEDRRGRRRLRGHGARARPRRHPPRRRRRPHERPGDDPRHPGGRDDPGDGQGADRPLRRGAGARGARGRLHRRVRGADARRRGEPHRQVGRSRSRSSAARRTSARRCGASARARR